MTIAEAKQAQRSAGRAARKALDAPQRAAANAALNAFNKELLANHIRTCVADDIRAGNDETIDELVGVLQKLMK